MIPGAIEIIRYWKKQKVKLALVSNGMAEVQRRKINRFALSKLFDYILIEGEFGFGKPDKRVFMQVLDKLNVDSSQAWMVGDNLEMDIDGAKKVGIYSIWIEYKGTGLPKSSPIVPDYIIKDITELTPNK